VLNRTESETEFWDPGQTRPNNLADVRTHSSTEKDQGGRKLIKRILVPIDFSPASCTAIDRALAIANEHAAGLTILHVVDINTQTEAEDSETLMKRLWSESASQMAQLAGKFSGQIKARTMIEEGLPWETIIEKTQDYDLVVLGKDNAKTRHTLFSQHTAQRVFEGAACPVMVVPFRNGE